MKNNYYVLLLFLLTFNFISAQEKEAQEKEAQEKKEKKSKFEIIGQAGIGFAVIKSDNEPKYNLNSNSGELLLNYKFSDKFGLATGFGHNQLSGNGFNSVGSFYHERSTLKIPLLITLQDHLSEKIDFLVNFGFYGQTIIKDEYQFLNTTQSNVYEGWNFGAEVAIGILFDLTEKMKIGVNFSTQADLSKFSTKDNQAINDKQKIENQNLVGLLLIFDL